MAPLHSDPTTIAPLVPQDDRPVQFKLRIRIPKQYSEEPVISRLISQYGLTVNITAALLSVGDRDDGWFELELSGPGRQIHSALDYMNDLDLEVWPQADEPADGW